MDKGMDGQTDRLENWNNYLDRPEDAKFWNSLKIAQHVSYVHIFFIFEFSFIKIKIPWGFFYTPRPPAALLMYLKKYSAVGNSAIGNYVVLYSKLMLKTVLLEISYGKNY